MDYFEVDSTTNYNIDESFINIFKILLRVNIKSNKLNLKQKEQKKPQKSKDNYCKN